MGGQDCQAWGATSLQQGDWGPLGLGRAENSCRNPDGDGQGVWQHDWKNTDNTGGYLSGLISFPMERVPTKIPHTGDTESLGVEFILKQLKMVKTG